MITPEKSNMPSLVSFIVLGNSVTVKVGDMITISSGYAVPVTGSGQRVLGVVRNIVKENGEFPRDNKGRPLTTVTTSSNNTTTERVGVAYYPAWLPIYWEADVNQNLGTTPNSNLPGYFNALSTNAGLVDEASYSETENATTPQQIISYGQYGGNIRKILIRFNPKQIF